LRNEQRFRKDLIYRINTVEITVPPLRERGDDVLLLVHHFLSMYEKKYMKRPFRLSDAAKNKLRQYSYPGNVRELQYAMERAVIMSDSELLEAADIVFSPLEQPTTQVHLPTNNLEKIERNTIEQVITKHNGNISRAAKELGITRAALYRRMEKYSL